MKDPSSLHSYLCLSAKREAIDLSRKDSLQMDVGVSEDEASSYDATSLEYLLPYRISKEEREIIGYRVSLGLSWKEITEITGIPRACTSERTPMR